MHTYVRPHLPWPDGTNWQNFGAGEKSAWGRGERGITCESACTISGWGFDLDQTCPHNARSMRPQASYARTSPPRDDVGATEFRGGIVLV